VPAFLALADRDSYFEAKVRERFEALEFAGSSFDPVDVLVLDPEAYRELRLEFHTAIQEQLVERLDVDSRRRLEEVIDALPKGGVVPVIGAGMSVPSGYPSWSGFLRDCALDRIDPTEVEALLESGEYEALASRVRDALGPNSFEERMAVFGLTHEPSEALLAAVQLFSSGHFVTTNFDALLEAACGELQIDLQVIEGCANWSGWSGEVIDARAHILLKLHGHYKRPVARVLLESEYMDAYSSGGAVRRDLETLLMHRSLVFLGASLTSDRTMQLAGELIAARPPGTSPRHHAFLPASRRTPARETFLGERGIFAIWYPDEDGQHGALGDLLWWATVRHRG
jgi:hypothetical protein